MNTKLDDFTGLYKVNHTLKFELRPVGKTLENLKKSGLLESDLKRSNDYPEVKKFLDNEHKKFLENTLSSISDIDWEPLSNAIKNFQNDKELKSDLEEKQEKIREKIVECFTNHEFF